VTNGITAYWLEQSDTDVAAGDYWLSAGEKLRLAGLRFEKRRREWRLGRWTAKFALASCLDLPADARSLGDIEIRNAPSGAPQAFFFNQRSDISISISHRAGQALCVVGLSQTSLGCDLEVVELRDHSFIADFFTVNEQKLVSQTRADQQPLLTTLVWSAKESALKALQVGLRVDTRLLDVSSVHATSISCEQTLGDDCAAWSPLSIGFRGERILRGCWRCAQDMVRTVVFAPLHTDVELERDSNARAA